MAPFDWFSSPASQLLALTLLHFLWQGLLVAGGAALLASCFSHRRADLRHAIYLVCFVVMAACPVVTFVVLEGELARSDVAPVATATDLTAVAGAPSLPSPRSGGLVLTAARRPGLTEHSAWPSTVYPSVVLLWLIGSLVVSLRMWIGLIGLIRYSSGIRPVPEEVARRVGRLCRRLNVTRLKGVFTSDRVAGAMAIGLLRPIVLLPSPWLAQFPSEVLDAIIAHELAHIRRLDLWVNLAQRVVETLLFYHPAVWWLSRRITVERELCCDEMAVGAIRQRVVYASALETVARRTRRETGDALALKIGQSRGNLLERVRNILGLAPAPEPTRFWSTGCFITVAILLVIGATTLRPTLSAGPKSSDVRTEMIEGLTRIERDIRELRSTIESLVASGVLRTLEEDFDGPMGRLHADKYFELGRFAAAARGYRAVLSRDPDHPDALDFLRKIRHAHRGAGELGAAIDVQRKIITEHEVDDRYRETMLLADLEMRARRYKDALGTVEQALDAATNWEERLSGSMFRSWYIELEHGPEAGLRAYQELERLIHSMGLEGKTVRKRIERLERIIGDG